MNIFLTLLLAVQLLSALVMIGLILVQHGKGADAGASLGGGSSGAATLFGASGGSNFMSRSTAILATLFLSSTLGLAYFGQAPQAEAGTVLETLPAAPPTPADHIPGVPALPAAPATAPAGAGQIPAQ